MPAIFDLNLNFELLLVAFALLIVLVVTTVVLSWLNVRAWRNTPLAADDAALETRIRQKQERIVDLDAAIAEREKGLRQRENAGADLRYLESRRDEIKAEILALEDGHGQLAQYEAELQDLVEQLAVKSEELEEKRLACMEQDTRVEAAERRADTAEKRIEGFKKVEAALRDEISQLEEQTEEAREIQREISELRDGLKTLHDDRARLQAEKARLERILVELREQVSVEREKQAELEL